MPSVARRSRIAASRFLELGLELRARAHEDGVIAVEDPGLLGRQPEQFALIEQRGEARIQCLVHEDRAAMPGKKRRHLALDRLQRVVGMAAGEVEEHGRHPAKLAPAPLHAIDGIREGRRRAVLRDRCDLSFMGCERAIERRTKVIGRDPLEGRELERGRPGCEEGIGRICRNAVCHSTDPFAGGDPIRRAAAPKASVGGFRNGFRSERGGAAAEMAV